MLWAAIVYCYNDDPIDPSATRASLHICSQLRCHEIVSSYFSQLRTDKSDKDDGKRLRVFHALLVTCVYGPARVRSALLRM